MTTRPLTIPAGVTDPAVTPAIRSADQWQRTNRFTPWGFIIMFIGVAIGVIGKMALHAEIVTVIGVLISLIGMFLTAYPSLSGSPRPKRDSSPPSQPEILTPPSPSASYLPAERSIEYVPSVTERTTQLLETVAGTNPKPKEDGESQG